MENENENEIENENKNKLLQNKLILIDPHIHQSLSYYFCTLLHPLIIISITNFRKMYQILILHQTKSTNPVRL